MVRAGRHGVRARTDRSRSCREATVAPPHRLRPRAMNLPVRRVAWPIEPANTEANLTREWLVTNALGGYASGTVAGVITRRYHGLLIAALPAPLGRIVMLIHIAEQLRAPDGRRVEIGGREQSGENQDARGHGHLVEFRLEGGLPVW